MANHQHIGDDVLSHVSADVAESAESQRAAREDIFRIKLAEAMRSVRKHMDLTQIEVAKRLGVGQSWVSKLESSNHDHTFESVLSYLDVIDANLVATILIRGREYMRVDAGEAGLFNECSDPEPTTSVALRGDTAVEFERCVRAPNPGAAAVSRRIRDQGLWGEAA
jgi:transcriptional regulator with XRE-family HTH domain